MPLDLSAALLSEADADHLQKTCLYQPFKLPGPIYTGAALGLLDGTNIRLMPENADHPLRDRFIAEVGNQAAMYDQLLDFVDAEIGIAGKSFLDIGANAGYFCYRASQLGASESVGFDIGDFDRTYSLVNDALSVDAKFVKGTYSQRRHELVGPVGEFDIVFNIAFLCHMSDPTFVIETLAERAKKALLIFSKFPREDDYLIRFSKTTHLYSQKRFPMCFNGATEVSDSLLEFAFKDLGFSRVLEVPKQSTWLPRSDDWRAFLAVR
jgi:2-polyprenyl-3-methyl-5-hydroxy-6-metoxy-1,4-benzoquinol methylase